MSPAPGPPSWRRLLVSCGEPSGDLYAGELVHQLRERTGPIDVFGLGGDRLGTQDARLVAHVSELAVVGLVEVLRHLRRLRAVFRAAEGGGPGSRGARGAGRLRRVQPPAREAAPPARHPGRLLRPVTSHTKEIIQTFWALSKELADARHYPAVDWLESFSGDVPAAARWWAENVDPGWQDARAEALELLAASGELQRVVNLVGVEALSSEQRWGLECASLIKEGLLQQSALDEVGYASPQKQYALLLALLNIHRQGMKLVRLGVPARRLLELPLPAEARRWKSQFGSGQLGELQAGVVKIYSA